MILCFTVEELEWEFEIDDCRQSVDISNCGKTIKKTSGGLAVMRLNNDIKSNLKCEINLWVKSELQNNAYMEFGLVIYISVNNGQTVDKKLTVFSLKASAMLFVKVDNVIKDKEMV